MKKNICAKVVVNAIVHDLVGQQNFKHYVQTTNVESIFSKYLLRCLLHC